MNSLFDWLNNKWQQFQDWLDSWQPCHKESMGYTCRHQMHGNVKECGEFPNYWKGDDE